MNTLKKTLMKDDPKKYHKTKIEVSGIKRTNNWQDVDSMIEKRNDKLHKYQKTSTPNKLEENFKKIIQNNFVNGELKDTNKMLRELKQIYLQNYSNDRSSEQLTKITKILKSMAEIQEGIIFKKYITQASEKIQNHFKQKKNRENEKCLEEYSKLTKTIKPNHKFRQQKKQASEKALKKLVHSTSAANLKIRVTRQQFQFEQDDRHLRMKKSLDLKNKSKVNSSSHKNLEGTNKLHAFLKDSNMKLVKTKIQYDYSAIFQASKTNIQQRNKTTFIQPKNQKEILTKVTKGKKDQAFVFYRPHKKH